MTSKLTSFWDKYWVVVMVIVIAALAIGTFDFVGAALSNAQEQIITKSNVTLVSETYDPQVFRDFGGLIRKIYWMDNEGNGYTVIISVAMDYPMPPLNTQLTIKYVCDSEQNRMLYSFVSEVPTPTPTVNPYKCVTNATTGACE